MQWLRVPGGLGLAAPARMRYVGVDIRERYDHEPSGF